MDQPKPFTSQTESMLMQERQFLEAILNTLDALVLVIDRKGCIALFNRACERMTGYTLAEVRGRPFTDLFVADEEAHGVQRTFDELLIQKCSNRHENHWMTRDGSMRLIAWSNSVLLDEQGEVGYIVATGVDMTEQRQAENTLRDSEARLRASNQALRDSEERYRVLFNTHHSPMLLIDPETGNIISANPAACEFYGWSREVLEQKKITEINVLPDDRTKQEMSIARQSRSSRRFFFQHRLSNGELRDVEVYSGPVRIGEHQYLFSIIHDITERKRIEEEIKNISLFPLENPNPVLRFTTDGRLLFSNKASEPLLDGLGIHLGGPAPEPLAQVIQAAVATGKIHEIELERAASIYEMQLIYIPNAGYVNAYGKNITLRKRLMEENQRQKELLDLIFQLDPGGLAVLTGPQLRFQYANPAYRRETPNPAIDPIGRPYEEIWPNQQTFRGREILQSVMDSGEPVYFDHHQRAFPDGSTHYFTFLVARLAWEGEHAVLTVLWNNTELELARQRAEKAAEEAEQRAQEAEQARHVQEVLTIQLQRANRELQDFAYIASHDLQEPLRKIQAFGDRLHSRYGEALGEEGNDYIQRMVKAAGRMSSMIRGLLDYSRVTTQAQPYRPVALTPLVQGVLSDLEVRLEETGGRVEVGELPTLQADPTQMRLLFQNLIGNALKFHPKGQRPVVRIYAQRILEPEQKAWVEITVEDQGIGFDVRYLERILQPFQRLHGRGEYEGNGMGLAICRKIVERHGGYITARSTLDQGTAFIVTLPEEAE